MKKRLTALLTAVALTVSMSGCQPHATELTNDLDTAPPAVTVSAEGDFMAAFAVSLLQATTTADNTLLSPLSVMCALSMTANGASGDTLAQMEQTLGLPLDDLNEQLYAYLSALPQENAALHLADSVWLKENGMEVAPAFLQACKDYYHADVFKAPFDGKTLDELNDWVKNNTDGMIDKILDKMPADAMMYLVNALAFEADWAEPYNELQIGDGVFTAANGDKQTVTMMTSTESAYLQTDNADGFLKYYEGGHYAFAALLPQEGVTVGELIASLDGNQLHTLLANPQDTAVIATLPQFDTAYETELSAVLKTMGMPDAFDPAKADFTAMGSAPDRLFISRVLHKTRMDVTPQGTTAGAATAVEMRCGSALLDEIKTVTLDRPFVYMLIDCETNAPFFIGTMMNVNG